VATDRPGDSQSVQHRHPDRLIGADAFRLHVTLILGLALCIAAFIFELLRALGGNTFSWMYVFEWPLFAGFALYMWWNLYNGNDRRRPAPPDLSDVEDRPLDSDLAAWNTYLRAMEAQETAHDHAPPRAPSSDPKTPPSLL
jgi:hypothetical protein